jgi:rubrerythrin
MKEISENNEILEFAIGREVRANRFYISLAERMADPQMKELFLALAKDELNHKERLEFELVKRGQTVPPDNPADEDEDEPPMIGTPNGLVMDYKAALEMMIQKENASFRLYADLAAKAQDNDSKEMLYELAEEELKHKMRFEHEYQHFIQADQ